MSTLDNANISKHLGKASAYIKQYDPSLLVRELRSGNREHLNISDDSLPFCGYDVWNAYEVSCLNSNGLPITSIAKITYPASSKYIVESKSLKLYLNSFNMTYFTVKKLEEIYSAMESVIAKDLSSYLETNVTVKMFDPCKRFYSYASVINDLSEYITLERAMSNMNIECNRYSESPDIIKSTENACCTTTQKYHSSLLKSNCRVTGAPDWGDVYIHYRGNHTIDSASLLQYIVSFRDENHFHEEICETIYKRFNDKLNPEELVVCCLYVRRGGIDINPIRANKPELIYSVFTDTSEVYFKTTRQ